VAIVRRAFQTRRVGHAGTLDPFATGLLLILVGQATRLARYLVGLPKAYRGVLRLGRTTTTESAKETETVLRFSKNLAPVKIAVLPLSKKEELSSIAKNIAGDLRKYWTVDYDETASIGRRYRRQDEIGTLFAVTIDFETMEDKKVTVRDRDTMKQDRVEISQLMQYFQRKLNE